MSVRGKRTALEVERTKAGQVRLCACPASSHPGYRLRRSEPRPCDRRVGSARNLRAELVDQYTRSRSFREQTIMLTTPSCCDGSSNNSCDNTSMTIAVNAEAATAAARFGLGMPPLDRETPCSTDFVRDTSTWGLFDIRGAHVKTPQAITCRRSATTKSTGHRVSESDSHRSGRKRSSHRSP